MWAHFKVASRLVAVLLFLVAVSPPPARAQSRSEGKIITPQNFASATPISELRDIDAVVPPVDPSISCPLEAVLKAAAERAQELVSSLPRFEATEVVEHFEADGSGGWDKPQTVTFDYMVELQQVGTNMLVMAETRDGERSLERFPAHLATTGLPVVAMVFHPVFAVDHDFKCEGLSSWDGRRAWQVRFEQRADRAPRLRGYRIKNDVWGLKLKGRAWVDALYFQTLHIDTDLMEPIPRIPLLREHFGIDYRPVHFRKQNEDLWLPQTAEVYMDYRGHRYRRKHTFRDFLLFSVDVDAQDKPPTDSKNKK